MHERRLPRSAALSFPPVSFGSDGRADVESGRCPVYNLKFPTKPIKWPSAQAKWSRAWSNTPVQRSNKGRGSPSAPTWTYIIGGQS
ncbi:hypothetical protein Zmor_008030 [Zophobas morio]|uniref:Uncharacterized protein n=1 Tax=Zophobas morio TaxID=2755281 RepID=A0AA38J1I4_9CUCU|nr:hypothetical protein Zmor_008030 [Zophobas morio]